MTITIHTMLIITAIVLFIVAAFPVASRFNLVAADLAFFAASFLVTL